MLVIISKLLELCFCNIGVSNNVSFQWSDVKKKKKKIVEHKKSERQTITNFNLKRRIKNNAVVMKPQTMEWHALESFTLSWIAKQ